MNDETNKTLDRIDAQLADIITRLERIERIVDRVEYDGNLTLAYSYSSHLAERRERREQQS